jgi:hypothetical protein
MRYRHAWSLDKTKKLKKLFKKGLTFLEIAHELGTNRSAVAGKLSRLGIYRTPHDYRLSDRKNLQIEHRRSISMFGDWDKVGAFRHCKWLDDDNRFCHEPVHKGSSFAFCPDHLKRVISQRSQHDLS